MFEQVESISIPNFDEISQSTAKIKVLPVSENGGPPYWNVTSAFEFNLCIVSGMSFCIGLLNFVIIRQSAAIESKIYFLVQV